MFPEIIQPTSLFLHKKKDKVKGKKEKEKEKTSLQFDSTSLNQ